MWSWRLLFCMALIVAVAVGYAAGAPRVNSPDGLQCSLSALDGGYKASNADALYGKLKVSGLDVPRPIVFELGREGRHLRRVYPSNSHGGMTINAIPLAEYAIYPTAGFVDRMLKDACGIAPEGLSSTRKLEALSAKASSDGEGDRHSKRLAVEALQALLGVEFSARMEYASTEGGDYRIYVGSDFKVTSTVRNRGSQQLYGVKLNLMPPDEWIVKLGHSASSSLEPGAATSVVSTVRAPGGSALRAPVFPVIASVTFNYSGRPVTIDYPFEVRLVDPFVPKLSIIKAYPDRIDAGIDLRTAYAGREMCGISVYPWLATDLTIGPKDQSVDMSRGRGSFRIAYLPEPSAASYRAVTVIMKLDEHLVRLRSVMEASLDLGATTTAAALWLNSYDDGLVSSATKGERKCRMTTPNALGPQRYMYFAASPNVPATGSTYVTITYFDDAEGSFKLHYDSDEDAYKECASVVNLEGTQTWKTKTFVLDDAGLNNRENADSDFRLVVTNGDLAISRVSVSKFLPENIK